MEESSSDIRLNSLEIQKRLLRIQTAEDSVVKIGRLPGLRPRSEKAGVRMTSRIDEVIAA